MIKIPEKEGRLSAAKAAHIEAVIAFVKRKTEGYRRNLFANISRVMLVSGTFEDMSARDDWSWLSDFILADVKTLKQMIGRPELLQFDEFKRMYSDYFSAGSDKYVDASTKYNAYMFIVCDQPYIKKETINKFINEFIRSKKNLGCVSNDGILLNPTIFTDKYKDKLLKLDGDKGGKKIILKNIDDLFIFDVLEKRELIDIDYKSQLENK